MDNNEQIITNDEQTTDIETNVISGNENGKQDDKPEQLSNEEVEQVESEEIDESKFEYGKNVKKRIDKLASKLQEKDAELNQLREELEKTRKTPQAQETTPTEQQPKMADFQTIEEYVEALSDYKLKIKESQNAVVQKQQQNQAKYSERVDQFVKVAPDFVQAVGEIQDVLGSDPLLVEAIIESDVGPQLSYHLANNEETLNKIMKLSPPKRLIELGKLELKLQAKLKSDDAPEAKQSISRVTSKANGSTAKPASNVAPSDYAEWVKWRKANSK